MGLWADCAVLSGGRRVCWSVLPRVSASGKASSGRHGHLLIEMIESRQTLRSLTQFSLLPFSLPTRGGSKWNQSNLKEIFDFGFIMQIGLGTLCQSIIEFGHQFGAIVVNGSYRKEVPNRQVQTFAINQTFDWGERKRVDKCQLGLWHNCIT